MACGSQGLQCLTKTMTGRVGASGLQTSVGPQTKGDRPAADGTECGCSEQADEVPDGDFPPACVIKKGLSSSIIPAYVVDFMITSAYDVHL